MTDPEPGVARGASRPTHVVGQAPQSPHVAGQATSNAAAIRLRAWQHPELVDEVGNAMAQLSAEDRALIRRSHYLGCSTSQIAQDLGIAEATAKSRLHYAVRALQLALQEMGVN